MKIFALEQVEDDPYENNLQIGLFTDIHTARQYLNDYWLSGQENNKMTGMKSTVDEKNQTIQFDLVLCGEPLVVNYTCFEQEIDPKYDDAKGLTR